MTVSIDRPSDTVIAAFKRVAAGLPITTAERKALYAWAHAIVGAEMARRGGQARAASMTPEERSKAASVAGRAPRPGRRKAAV